MNNIIFNEVKGERTDRSHAKRGGGEINQFLLKGSKCNKLLAVMR